MDDFYAARSRLIPPLPWQTFSPPLSVQLRIHLSDFLDAYNFVRCLKTLSGLTPYEYICKIWTSEPDRFIDNPVHQMHGLNSSDNPRIPCS